jgi:hypothetical protein
LVPRLLLLACVALGVAAMHTLGHAGMDHSMRADAAQSMHSAIDLPLLDVMTASGAAMSAYAYPGEVVADIGSHGGVVGWAVCLAVLGTAVVLLMLTWAAWRRAAVKPAPDSRRYRARALMRAPPVRLGLRLVDLSVVRR